MRTTFIVPLLSGLIFTGCITANDARVNTVRSRVASKEAFAGTYSNNASYRSEQVLVLEYLDAHLELRSIIPAGATHVIVSFDANALRAEVCVRDRILKTHRFVLGKDCRFEQGFLVFNSRLDAESGHDSPTFGFVGTVNMRWTLDEHDNLIVVVRKTSASTVGIVPVTGRSRGMAIFQRIKTPKVQEEPK